LEAPYANQKRQRHVKIKEEVSANGIGLDRTHQDARLKQSADEPDERMCQTRHAKRSTCALVDSEMSLILGRSTTSRAPAEAARHRFSKVPAAAVLHRSSTALAVAVLRR